MAIMFSLILLVAIVFVALWLISQLPPIVPGILRSLLAVLVILMALAWLFQFMPGFPALK